MLKWTCGRANLLPAARPVIVVRTLRVRKPRHTECACYIGRAGVNRFSAHISPASLT